MNSLWKGTRSMCAWTCTQKNKITPESSIRMHAKLLLRCHFFFFCFAVRFFVLFFFRPCAYLLTFVFLWRVWANNRPPYVQYFIGEKKNRAIAKKYRLLFFPSLILSLSFASTSTSVIVFVIYVFWVLYWPSQSMISCQHCCTGHGCWNPLFFPFFFRFNVRLLWIVSNSMRRHCRYNQKWLSVKMKSPFSIFLFGTNKVMLKVLKYRNKDNKSTVLKWMWANIF